MSSSTLKFLIIGFAIVMTMSSCVPIAIGAAGVAVGYIARDEGVGVADPAGSSSPDSDYDSYEPAVY